MGKNYRPPNNWNKKQKTWRDWKKNSKYDFKKWIEKYHDKDPALKVLFSKFIKFPPFQGKCCRDQSGVRYIKGTNITEYFYQICADCRDANERLHNLFYGAFIKDKDEESDASISSGDDEKMVDGDDNGDKAEELDE